MFLRRLFGLVPSDPFTEGLQRMQKGELRPALAVFEPLLDSPDEGIAGMAALYACEALLQLGDRIVESDPAAAVECYESASGLQPGFADIHHRIGRVRHGQGRTDAALAAFERSLAINPNFFSARLEAFEIRARRGDEDLAGAYEELKEYAPPVFQDEIDGLRSLLEAGNAEALAASVAALREHTPDPRRSVKLRAVEALQGDRPEEAIEILRSAPDGGRTYPDLLHLMGLAHGRLDQHEEAEEAFRAALDIHPGLTKSRINLALTLIEGQRWDEAEAELRAVLEQEPDHPLALGALEEIRSATRGA